MKCRVCGREIGFARRLDKRQSMAYHVARTIDEDNEISSAREIKGQEWVQYVPAQRQQRELRARLESGCFGDDVGEINTSIDQTVSPQSSNSPIRPTPIGRDGQHETRLLTPEQEAQLRKMSTGRQPYDSLASLAEESIRHNEPNRFNAVDSRIDASIGERVNVNEQGETIEEFHRRTQLED